MDSTLSMKEYQGLVCMCSVHNSDAHEPQTHVSSLPFNWSSASAKFTTVSPGGMRSTGGEGQTTTGVLYAHVHVQILYSWYESIHVQYASIV